MTDMMRFKSKLLNVPENQSFKELTTRSNKLFFLFPFVLWLASLVFFAVMITFIFSGNRSIYEVFIKIFLTCMLGLVVYVGFISCLKSFRETFIGFPIYKFWDKEGFQHIRKEAPTLLNGKYYWSTKGVLFERDNEGNQIHPFPELPDNAFFEIDSPIFVVNSANRQSKMKIIQPRGGYWKLFQYYQSGDDNVGVFFKIGITNFSTITVHAHEAAMITANFLTLDIMITNFLDSMNNLNLLEEDLVRAKADLDHWEKIGLESGAFLIQLHRLVKDWPRSSPYLKGVRQLCENYIEVTDAPAVCLWEEKADQSVPLDGTKVFPELNEKDTAKLG